MSYHCERCKASKLRWNANNKERMLLVRRKRYAQVNLLKREERKKKASLLDRKCFRCESLLKGKKRIYCDYCVKNFREEVNRARWRRYKQPV